MKKIALSLLASVAVAMPAAAQDMSGADALMQRGAMGDASTPDGARRLRADNSAAYRDMAIRDAEAEVRNVILLIGDGMGDSEITIARNYAEGAGGYFKGLDALPVSGQYTHYSLDRETGKPVYVTDSAASATAFSTGVKSYNGAIGVDIRGTAHASLLQLAKAAGLATGNVSTAEIQDATPAAQIAHIALRDCKGPGETTAECPAHALENGGPGSIAEQLLDARPDVTLGGGAKYFRQSATAGKWQGRSLLEQAEDRGFHLVTTAQDMAAVTGADQGTPLLGLFADGNLPVRWQGPSASYHGNLEQPPVTCAANPARPDSQPTLAAMTGKAIQLLSANPNGFFLQVEGASIDKQSHAANPCAQIGETVDLDEAVQVAIEFAKQDGHTLVIVTADHAHAGQIVYPDAHVPGLSQSLLTSDGAVMTVSYGNAEEGSMGHTGTQLRVAAYGPRAFNVTGLLDQTDIFHVMRDALGLADGGE
ncbi:alkaline phosphatase [Altererythrobacter atlanticus]|uniref:Alkaline phosphatase n=1 Tax=Croceibacterium atlanticum TaxID=1267766 RepID=A0A0F7KV06_9SPHN|nr:alkaline phosphatase [Croceibacterium atlanticum]AKH43072.1 Alkaline phosphatase precursor [Croceibacterium atlanticum]MBB5732225.1 alkaline phosphatase [Croceibacterium atlanticum]